MAGGQWFSKFLLEEFKLGTQEKQEYVMRDTQSMVPPQSQKGNEKIKANKYNR